MKKVLLIAVVLLMTSALAFAGGKKDSGGGSGEAPFIVDLKTLSAAEVASGDKVGKTLSGLKNETAFTKPWDNFIVLFPENFVDVSKYQRVTITVKVYDASGNPMEPADSQVQVNFVKDINGDWRGPPNDPGPNTPLKAQNVGGFSGLVNKDRGIRHGCSVAPAGMIVQAAQAAPAFIELTGIIFHNSNYKSN